MSKRNADQICCPLPLGTPLEDYKVETVKNALSSFKRVLHDVETALYKAEDTWISKLKKQADKNFHEPLKMAHKGLKQFITNIENDSELWNKLREDLPEANQEAREGSAAEPGAFEPNQE